MISIGTESNKNHDPSSEIPWAKTDWGNWYTSTDWDNTFLSLDRASLRKEAEQLRRSLLLQEADPLDVACMRMILNLRLEPAESIHENIMHLKRSQLNWVEAELQLREEMTTACFNLLQR